ncbi:MAG: hypothetical protein WC868_06960 [Bacteroidales bacterium]
MKRQLYILIIALIFVCCNKTEKKPIENLFSYKVTARKIGHIKQDTFTIDKIKHHNNKDTLIATQDFELNGRNHLIKMYFCNYWTIDGEEISYELDDLGIIYSRSTTWPSCIRLKSNNDSINLVIDAALENIILYSKLRCIDMDKMFKNTIKFVEPKVD